MEICLVKFDKPRHFNCLEELVTNERVCSHLGNGKVWSQDKIHKLFDYVRTDDETLDTASPHFYRVIECSDTNDFIGFLGIHPVNYDKKGNLYLTIAILEKYQAQGIGKCAIMKLLSVFRYVNNTKFVFADVHNTNIPSKKLMEKCGFLKMKRNKFRTTYFTINK